VRPLGNKSSDEKDLSQATDDKPSSQKEPSPLKPQVAAKNRGMRVIALQTLKAFRAAYSAAREQWLAGIYPPYSQKGLGGFVGGCRGHLFRRSEASVVLKVRHEHFRNGYAA
jgi:hypothetical protein